MEVHVLVVGLIGLKADLQFVFEVSLFFSHEGFGRIMQLMEVPFDCLDLGLVNS